jgi:peptidoglycan hydrolase-like protein with peptidoglycan-binding domain
MSLRFRRELLVPVALVATLSGCGKSLAGATSRNDSHAIASLSAQGAVGLNSKNTARLGGVDPATDAASIARAVYLGLTKDTRPDAVVLVDEHDWPIALVGSVLAGVPLHAPLLYTDGGRLPAPTKLAIGAMTPTGSASLEGAQIIQIGVSAAPSRYRVYSISGGDVYTLAVEVQRLVGFVNQAPPSQVIVVAADGPPSLAMPAAGLAAQTGAPILLVRQRTLPAATRAALVALRHPSIYVVGPRQAVSERVFDQLRRLGHTHRIAGEDPIRNAIAVAEFSDGSFGWAVNDPGHGLVFANLARPLDAPAGALLSASGDYGPLLVLSRLAGLDPPLASYLTDIQPGYSDSSEFRPVRGVYNHGFIIGDEHAISATTQAEIDALLEISPRSSSSTQAQVP